MAKTTTAIDSPPAEPVATRQERIDFLKQAVAFTESNVRSYDIKAQISLAAFVLSGNPLVTVVNTACGQPASRHVLVIVLVLFLVTILSYLWVLWPMPPQEKLTEGLRANNLFYLRDPRALGGAGYSARLMGLVVEPELTAEVLKLSYIRTVKARRFKIALIATVIAYLGLAVSFFAVGRCAW